MFFIHSPYCIKDVFKSPCAVLFAKFVDGAILILSFDMSNTVSPGVSSILSLILSRFSSGYFSRDVLFVEYIAVIYQVPVAFVVCILIFSASCLS